MSLYFTIVPEDLRNASRDFLRWVAMDPGVVINVEDEATIYFAGSRDVAKEATTGQGLASIRILGRGVFEVDLDGYEASADHASRYIRMAITTFPCRIFAGDTGEELTFVAKENPAVLFTYP